MCSRPLFSVRFCQAKATAEIAPIVRTDLNMVRIGLQNGPFLPELLMIQLLILENSLLGILCVGH